MQRLGGSCLGFADPGSRSAAKGASLADTVRMTASYADVIVMRNPKEGAALVACRYSEVPVINAGDGGHHHPTQTLTDLLTIRRLRGEIRNLTVASAGILNLAARFTPWLRPFPGIRVSAWSLYLRGNSKSPITSK